MEVITPNTDGVVYPWRPTIGFLTDEIIDTVKDPSYTRAKVLTFINRGISEIAGQRDIYLPDLEQVQEVQTIPGSSTVLMPLDYMKGLHRVYNITRSRKIKIYGSLTILSRYISDYRINQTGEVEGVAVVNRHLAYQLIPSTTETLRLHYFSYPLTYWKETDVPTIIPEHLIAKLLINYACMIMFGQIEDAIEGQKSNTKYHTDMYQQALVELLAFLGPVGHELPEIRDDLRLGSLLSYEGRYR